MSSLRLGRRVAKVALQGLGWARDETGDPDPVKRVAASAVCVMASDRWWTATAVGRDENGWVGACSFISLNHDKVPYPVWSRDGAVDLTELYLLFTDAGTHTTKPAHVEDDLHVAQVRGLLLGGFQQLLAPIKGFDLESAEFLSALTPDGEAPIPPPYARRWNDAEADVPWMTGPVRPADGQTCWMQWTAGNLTASGNEDVAGMRRRSGMWALKSINLLDRFQMA